MTKTKNRKGKKKHLKHLDNVAARSETVQSKPAPQFATFGSASTSAAVSEVSKAAEIRASILEAEEKIRASRADALLENPATNGQDADFAAKVYAYDEVATITPEQAEALAKRVADLRRAELGQINITDLRKYSKGSGISGAYGLKKPDLIEAIIAAGWYNS